ncbi:metastasis-associated protein MTA3-like isoform X2 [Ornithodoros turicata]|uniref:metastasis-associated protein MTA3-like isoform X2 n=1 Tax=Ornithodoros turicata TaxID=34597 RepID=UPI00313A201E
MAANMYRVGDYVFFETSSTAPYQIRRIEELVKTPSGNVEAKVMCYYRRRDISGSLMAEKQQSAFVGSLEEEQEREADVLTEKERHQLKHRELFLSRQVETLPATHIRGKCSVTLLNETESLLSYLNKDDSFFYSLVYDPQQKTLLADRGEIRVGSRYQAEVPPWTGEPACPRDSADLEVLMYTPSHVLSDRQLDQFLIVCRSVGTFARALDCSSSVKQPSLHMSAAAASRDVTLLHAMEALHRHAYDIAEAVSSLVPPGGPVLCRDEMEEWSASEANLFEEALEKYGKDFGDIRQDFLPWKSLKNIVEYYYMWKTTDRYVQQKRVKAVEAESKLKQVYIPNYNNKSGTTLGGPENATTSGRPCESCYTMSSTQWYAWGPAHMQCRLCFSCWTYWKKFGGLKYPTRLESADLMTSSERLTPGGVVGPASHRPHRCTITGCGKEFKLKAHLARHCATAHGLALRAGSPRPVVKTRAAFYLCTTPLTRATRRMCGRSVLRPRHAARNPFQPINVIAIKQECQNRLVPDAVPQWKGKPRDRGLVVDISHRLGTPNLPRPEWLHPTPRDQIVQPQRQAFPPPPRGDDGRLLLPPPRLDPTPPPYVRPTLASPSSLLRKRPYDHANGEGSSSAKRRLAKTEVLAPPVPLNGRAKVATITRIGGRKHMISWVDAPDDLYFIATEATRRMRRQLTIPELRRSARRPCRRALGPPRTASSSVTPSLSGSPPPTADPIVILD